MRTKTKTGEYRQSAKWLILTLVFAFNVPVCGLTITDTDTKLSVTVNDANGAYQIATKEPAWVFGGSIGKTLKDAIIKEGTDGIGKYQEIVFGWDGEIPMGGEIRLYRGKSIVLFTMKCQAASEKVTAYFPSFTVLPQELNQFCYAPTPEFGLIPFFWLKDTDGPYMLFDDSANACIISPASNFMVARMRFTRDKVCESKIASITSGLNDELSGIPNGFTHRTLFVSGKGINRTWDAWGQAIIGLGGGKRPLNDADAGVKYLGYWTDREGAYYYNYDLSKGYEKTLLDLAEHLKKEGIPIRYFQVDSWWYPKTPRDHHRLEKSFTYRNPGMAQESWNYYGGMTELVAHKDVFPEGLSAFQKKIGLPLIVHSKWISYDSPYRKKYKISGTGAVDPNWWDDVISSLAAMGVVTYEQDWLHWIYEDSAEMRGTVYAGEAFMDNMARACRKNNITMQYCIANSRHWLQGTKYSNFTTARVSDDRFCRARWYESFFNSRLAGALGIYPWVDVFFSYETENILLATLSAGMVGPGDPIGEEDKKNIFLSVRSDGVIVKPDSPIVPVDDTYIAEAHRKCLPVVAYTVSDHGQIKTAYVFAYTNEIYLTREVGFSPASLGFTGDVYVYNFFAGTGRIVDAKGLFREKLDSRLWAYYIVAPVGRSGVAFLGDSGKFVSCGRQRISRIVDESKKLTVTVVFAQGENSIKLHGYSRSKVKFNVPGGNAEQPVFDTASGHFSVIISPAVDAKWSKPPDKTTEVTVVIEPEKLGRGGR